MKWFAGVLVSLVVSMAFAIEPTPEQKQQAREQYESATKHFRGGDLDKAAAEFKQAYDLTGEVELLWNLAQTHRLARHYEQALFFYKQYLSAKPQLSTANRAALKQRIGELETLVDQQHHAQTAPPDGPERPAEVQATTPAEPTQTQVPPQAMPAVQPAPTPPPAWYSSVLGWSLFGGGLVAIGVGGGLFAHGNDLDSQIPMAPSLARADQLASDRDTFRNAGISLIAIGGAAVVGGAVVFAVAGARHKAAHAYVTPSTQGVLMGGAF
jgi:tetratricopeptide (TPR) repeat protein